MPDVVKLDPMNIQTVVIPIEGTTPLICHQFSEKARKEMRDKKLGAKVKQRRKLDAEAECEAATYRLSDGTYGIPATALKNAIASAAHKDLGFPRTILRKGLFVQADETPPGGIPLIRMKCSDPVMREDVVRVGSGSSDLRYRPEFSEWSFDLRIEYDVEWLTVETILALLQRAGFGVGLCEWRPERGGDFGRFKVVAQTDV